MKRILLVVVLVGLGWAVGFAQSVRGDFELRVEASNGGATLTCVRGCNLRGFKTPTETAPSPSFSYACSTPPCGATVYGFSQK